MVSNREVFTELPRGLTGYNSERLLFKSFKAFCFSLQSYGVCNVVEIHDYEYPKNYFSALVEDSEDIFYILQNAFVPLAALAVQEADGYVFIKKPSIEKVIDLQNNHLYLLFPEVLNEKVTDQHIKSLINEEQAAIRYWLPETIGGLLFSWYFD